MAAGARRGWDSALVTGASSGIGAAFARRLAAGGCELILVGRRPSALSALAAELYDAYGKRPETVVADLASPVALTGLVDGLARWRPELLVNCAGGALFGPFREAAMPAVEELVAVHCTAPMRLSHAILPDLVERGRGGILNVCSVEAFYPQPYHAAYAAAKAFLLSWSQGVSEELRGTGVRVVALCPGLTRSAFHRRAGLDVSGLPQAMWSPPAAVAAAGLAALEAGRPVRVHRLPNAAAAVGSRLLPLSVIRRVTGRAGRQLIAGRPGARNG